MTLGLELRGSLVTHQEGRGDGGRPADPRPAVDQDPGVGALTHRGIYPVPGLLEIEAKIKHQLQLGCLTCLEEVSNLLRVCIHQL